MISALILTERPSGSSASEDLSQLRQDLATARQAYRLARERGEPSAGWLGKQNALTQRIIQLQSQELLRFSR
jgi:hypothetical protein